MRTRAEEFQRQEDKIVSALAEIDADIVGLIEIENNGTAVAALTAALNAEVGAGTYAHIETGVIGTDEIATALIYKPATVVPLGDEAILDSSIDPDFADNNRPALAQTFEQVGGSESVTVVVNHLKSKGSACAGDPDLGDGAGNCNITRTKAAAALAKWLATDPTGQGAGRELIIGDLNSYDKEDPIDALRTAGYTDLLFEFQGENAYSYVFDGQLGYLDYALAGKDLAEDVTGAEVWRINADEPSLIDYDMDFKQPAQDALWAPDPYRSSDHDPVVVGLELTPPDTTPPTITRPRRPRVDPPPNDKMRTVTIDVDAADDSGDVTVEARYPSTASGTKKAAVTQITDTRFSVMAAVGAVYTFTYDATDAAGNTRPPRPRCASVRSGRNPARSARIRPMRADRRFELPEQRSAAAFDHREHFVEHRRPRVVRIGNVERARRLIERHEQSDLVGVGLVARPSAQDALVAAVERDHQVVAREVGVRELAGAVAVAVVPVPFERVDRALIGALADVPVTGPGARRGDAVTEARGIREPAEARHPPSVSGRCCPCTRTRRGRAPRGSQSCVHSATPSRFLHNRRLGPLVPSRVDRRADGGPRRREWEHVDPVRPRRPAHPRDARVGPAPARRGPHAPHRRLGPVGRCRRSDRVANGCRDALPRRGRRVATRRRRPVGRGRNRA